METYKEIRIASTVQFMDQGVLFAFKSYYLRHTLHRARATTGNDSFDGLEQSTLKIFQKRLIILDAIKNAGNS